jgi:hypothetical protein
LTRYIIEEAVEKMNIDGLESILDEAVSLGYNYVETCRICRGWKLCVYIAVEPVNGEHRVRLIGLTIKIPYKEELGDEVKTLLKFSTTIIGCEGTALFYIPRQYSLGVYYSLCSGERQGWIESRLVEPEEVVYFTEEGE